MIGLRTSKWLGLVVLMLLLGAAAASAQSEVKDGTISDYSNLGPNAQLPRPPKVLFIHQDAVPSFPATGDGVHLGTVRGWLNGISVTNFQFIPDAPPNFHSYEFCLFMDLEGDQIMFVINWLGRIIEPLRAPASTINKNRDMFTLTGVFTGTYEVTDATGKYRGLIGKKYPCRGMAGNSAKSTLQPFGASYTEVYEDTPSVP